MHHIVKLPLGYFSQNASGRLRKVIDDNAGLTENFLAHQLPDLTGAVVMPIAVLVLIFVFDWRLGVCCLVPLVISVYFLKQMMGGDNASFMEGYMTALETMNKEAVEYIRGIPVVKVFQQTVYSFKNFHVAIEEYEKYASGSGKSTAAKLIPRFYDASEGEVLVGGVNVKDMDKEALMKQIAFVFQSTKLFKDTLLENIRAARPEASREEVLRAAKATQCDEIIDRLPEGLDTIVGNGGTYLSGGENQRVALLSDINPVESRKGGRIMRYLKEKYALSDEGAKDLCKGILYSVLVYISLMLPVALFALVLNDFLTLLLTKGGQHTNVGFYVIAGIVILAVIFIMHYMQYTITYMGTYEESERRRITLAEKLRTLPIRFFQEHDISFTAKQGQITALIGSSGGGKSTIANLAAGFYDVNGGTIRLGGTDISPVDSVAMMKEFSVVFQNVVLFNNTVMENIRVGRKNATDEEVIAAAKAARCHDFIEKLPEGYQTVIGENGTHDELMKKDGLYARLVRLQTQSAEWKL